jgi:hypothetical protein
MQAGVARHRVATHVSAVDAIVAAIAAEDDSTILTSDPDDLTALIDALGTGRVRQV